MKWLLTVVLFSLLVIPITASSQQVVYSDYDKDDSREMNFEIIGKMNGNVLVYKNLRWKHRICLYDANMQTKECVDLD
ncbi:MAG TPA: hypothetical protein VKH37_09330, partial [Ferruginibacter sp.]|nr:hypothetical protein [Ferruginibacter sp.]